MKLIAPMLKTCLKKWAACLFRLTLPACCLVLICGGCDGPSSPARVAGGKSEKVAAKQTTKSGSSTNEAQATKPKEAAAQPKKTATKQQRAGIKRGTLGGGPAQVVARGNEISFTETAVLDRLLDVVDETNNFGPTLVIWCLDETASAREFVSPITDRIKTRYEQRGEKKHPLLYAVYGFSDSVRPLTDKPAENAEQLQSALTKIAASGSESENGISAVQKAYDDLRKYKQTGRHQILVVVVSDEAPSDRDGLDATLELLSSDETPVYVIGKPAPFGRTTVSIVGGSEKSLTYGPETIAVERIDSDYWNDTGGMEALDSGFGPWAYERLCRRTEGRFLAVRPSGGGFASRFARGWPTGSQPFALDMMSRYAPDYGPEKDYLASLETNAAKRALHDAAQLPRTTFNPLQRVMINAGNEAGMAREILRVQQQIAAGSNPVKRLFDTIKAGEADRESLDTPRWKVSYDLALARAAANYVRLDGANAMLAKAKSGMSFTNADNNAWLMEPSEEIITGGSHRRTAESATSLLLGIVKNFPETPWAYIAGEELKSPMGWKWTETRR